MIVCSNEMAACVVEVKAFLHAQRYRHPRIARTTAAARRVVCDLFGCYAADPAALPERHAVRLPLQQAVIDYIAGMTDRFALREYARVFGPGRSGLAHA